MKHILRVLIIGLLCSALIAAADLDGTWLGRIASTLSSGAPDGGSQEVAFQFVQKGTTLTGKMYGENQSSPISEGKVSGDQIDFVVLAPEQQGNQMLETKLRFRGSVKKEGELEVTRVRESSTNAGNTGTYDYKSNNTKQTFSLKRLF